MPKQTRDAETQAPPWESDEYEGKHTLGGVHGHAYAVSLADYHRRFETANSPTLIPNPPPLQGFGEF